MYLAQGIDDMDDFARTYREQGNKGGIDGVKRESGSRRRAATPVKFT